MKNSKITSLFKKIISPFGEIFPIKKRPMHATFKDMSSSHCHNNLFVNVSFTHNRYPICHFHIWVQRVVLKRDLIFGDFVFPHMFLVFSPQFPCSLNLWFVKCSLCCSHSSHASQFLFTLAPHHISSHISWWKVPLLDYKMGQIEQHQFYLGSVKSSKTSFSWRAKSKRTITRQVNSKQNLYLLI
jgi:hypothetical protein